MSTKNPAEIVHGPVLIGFTFNAILLGSMLVQVYLYYTNFKNDKKFIKWFVAILTFLDLLNTACNTGYLYLALIRHFGNYDYLGRVTWLFDNDPFLTGIIVTMCQSFFAWRIWVLTKSKVWPALIMVFAIAGGVAAILTPIYVARNPFFLKLQEAKVPIILWLSCEVIGDILITAILVIYLRNHKTGFEKSDMLIDRIIRLTIQTGAITMIVAGINLIVYLVDESGNHLIFNFPLCKLYSNSLMSTLNSRGIWMSGRSDQTTMEESKDHGMQSYVQRGPPVVQPPMHMKASDMINFSGTHKTEVYVNVESHELKDVNGRPIRGSGAMNSPTPPSKESYDYKNIYP